MSSPNPYEPPTEFKTPLPTMPTRNKFGSDTFLVVGVSFWAAFLIWSDYLSYRDLRTFNQRTIVITASATILLVLWALNYFVVPFFQRRQFNRFFQSEFGKAKRALDELRFNDCIEHMTGLIDVWPLDVLFWYRGIAHKMRGDYYRALDDFESAVNDDTRNPHLVAELSKLLSTSPVDKIRHGERALELAERAIELGDPNDYVLVACHAVALAEQGNFDLAIIAYEKSLANVPDGYRHHSEASLRQLRDKQPIRCNPESDVARLKTALRIRDGE